MLAEKQQLMCLTKDLGLESQKDLVLIEAQSTPKDQSTTLSNTWSGICKGDLNRTFTALIWPEMGPSCFL